MTQEKFKAHHCYDSATPMLQQYLNVKSEYQDALLLFRLGDFYELFFNDAIIASKILDITLTKRGQDANGNIPMCGIPFHALDAYLPKLIETGHKIAICDQIESVEEAKQKRGNKAVVNREVVRVITSGTIIDDKLLDANFPHYLAAIVIYGQEAAISFIDITTGEFIVTKAPLFSFIDELNRIAPKEIIVSEKAILSDNLLEMLAPHKSILTYQPDQFFVLAKCEKVILDFYNIYSIQSLGELEELHISAIGVILEYLNLTQKSFVPRVPFPKLINFANSMIIDTTTRKSLEITSTANGQYNGSLYSVLNKCITKQGSRLLYKYLSNPLSDTDDINHRLNITECFWLNIDLVSKIRNLLKHINDIEKSLGRISAKRASALDLLAIRYAIEYGACIKTHLFNTQFKYQHINEIIALLKCDEEIDSLIQTAIKEDSSGNMAEGGFIKSSYHSKVSELRDLIENSGATINAIKLRYQKETGIENIKICQNNILGLFIEITPKYAHKINNNNFIHKQTTATAIRFTTSELQKLDNDIVHAKNLLINLEQEIFINICDKILSKIDLLRDLAYSLSFLDVFCNFAYIAYEYNYTRPIIANDNTFLVEEGRHPTVEQNIYNSFIPNDCDLSSDHYVNILTGSNMGGKSTFLKQNALIAILSHIGCFVPAKFAHIGTIDRIFSRIGAHDDITNGKSTFMVEMIETAAILSQATSKSFAILDEIGRGTSTCDGMSIAWACLEYIHNIIKCRTIFATHYHELTELESKLLRIRNYTVLVEKNTNNIIFLYKVVPGIANESYGIHVAAIAGLPQVVISRATEILINIKNSRGENTVNTTITTNFFPT